MVRQFRRMADTMVGWPPARIKRVTPIVGRRPSVAEVRQAPRRDRARGSCLIGRDGPATINGSNLFTAMSALYLFDTNRRLKRAEIACAMSLEALHANLKPYDLRLHHARGFPGAVRSAQAIMRYIEGSDLATGKLKIRVQDAYCMRSTPQVIGAAHDAVAWAREQVEIQLDAVAANPSSSPSTASPSPAPTSRARP